MDWLTIDWLAMFSEFHFLRPLALLAILPALIACWWLYHRQNHTGNWEHVIAPELLPLLMDGVPVKQRQSLVLIALTGWVLATLAMAGPTWERTPLPVHKQESALVILFDLSPSMLAQDLKPNRLTRARLKLIDLLQQRKEGTTALVAYAGEAFVVSPLTDDAETITALIPALDPNIMPRPGNNTEAAVEHAIELVFNAGLTQADFLLVTDDIPLSARETLDVIMRNTGDFRLSILGIGTEEGAPIPLNDGGFAKDNGGNIVIPRLNVASLKKLTNRYGGSYSNLTTDDTDINYLTETFSVQPGTPGKQLERTFDTWNDQGYWMVLPLLLILLLAFRRGLLVCLLIAPILTSPQTAHAFSWVDIWSTPDQQAAKAMLGGDTEKAQERFKDPQWKASAAYRNSDFKTAEQLYSNDTAWNHYNRGNAQAKAGKLEEAIESYNQALSLSPDNEDAQFNKELVDQLLQQQQNSQQDSQKSDSSEKQKNQQEPSSDDSSDPSGEDQQSNNQQNDQQDQSSTSNDQQPNDNQSDENQQASAEDSPQDQDKQPAEGDQNKQQGPTQQSDQEEQSGDENEQVSSESKKMTDEEKQAMEQWLRRIPDDPGGLLREKFRYEIKKRNYERRRGINTLPDHDEERW